MMFNIKSLTLILFLCLGLSIQITPNFSLEFGTSAYACYGEDDEWESLLEIYYGEDGQPAGMDDRQEEAWERTFGEIWDLEFDMSIDDDMTLGEVMGIPDGLKIEIKDVEAYKISISNQPAIYVRTGNNIYSDIDGNFHFSATGEELKEGSAYSDNVDINHNGYKDGTEDFNHDGINDFIEDRDGNGQFDYFQDNDMDGVPDREEPYDPNDFESDDSGGESESSDAIENNLFRADNDPTKGEGKPTEVEKITPANEKLIELQAIMDKADTNPDTNPDEVQSIKDAYDAIRSNLFDDDPTVLKEKYVEYGFTIENRFYLEDPYVAYDGQEGGKVIQKGGDDAVSVERTRFTIITVHDHPKSDKDNDENNIAAPSPQDIEATILRAIRIDDDNRTIFDNQIDKPEGAVYVTDENRSYKGEHILAYTGDEYFIYVQDLGRAKEFIEEFGDNFSNAKDFNNKDFNIYFESVLKTLTELKDPPFSLNEARSFALAYVLEKYNSGIKMMKKEVGSDFFVEQNFNQSPDGTIDPYFPVNIKHP